jgi:hypothetical protein
MKPTVEELVSAQKVLNDANNAVRGIVNEYAVRNRIHVFVSVFGGKVLVLLDAGRTSRVWVDGQGARCLSYIHVDYDEAAIRDRLVEAEKVIEERKSK